jgi:hypothetical protein
MYAVAIASILLKRLDPLASQQIAIQYSDEELALDHLLEVPLSMSDSVHWDETCYTQHSLSSALIEHRL